MTRPEIETTFGPELTTMGKTNGLTYDQTMEKLTRLYDGYKFFQVQDEKVFNPFSVLKALKGRSFGNFWFATGTPSFLVDMLKRTNYDLRNLDGIQVSAASLTDYRADYSQPIPVIYQSGYLTIKEYNDEFMLYTLGYPNDEVKYGFLNFIAPFYTPIPASETPFYIGRFVEELRARQTEEFLTRLQAFFADFPYELNEKTERHYQVVFYLVFKLMGQFTEAEVHSSRGRADAVVKTADYIYLFEFKLDGSAEEALAQIDDKGYPLPYRADGRKVIKVGASFSAADHNIDCWLIK